MKKNIILKKRGAAVLIAVLFFVIISMILVLGTSSSFMRDYLSYRDFQTSKNAYYLAEAGLEDAMYRLKQSPAPPVGPTETITLDGNTVVTTITDVPEGKLVSSVATTAGNVVRKASAILTQSTIASFDYGGYVGAGGLTMSGSTNIDGSVFSRGSILGNNSIITGSVTSRGTTGLNGSITRIINQGTNSMRAGTISNSTITGVPYCWSAPSSQMGSPLVTAVCSLLTPVADRAFPITDTQMVGSGGWKDVVITNGATKACTGGKYQVSSSETISVPTKIDCDLRINGGSTLTLGAVVWVTGDVEIKAGGSVNVDLALGAQSVPILADPGTALLRLTKGKITIEQDAEFNVGQNPFAQVILASWNTSASTGGGNTAIEVEDDTLGNLIVYAPYGEVKLKDDAQMTDMVGYKVTMEDRAKINYTNNLQNMLIYAGPPAVLTPWVVYDWREAL
ncbi:MAG: hypothetical protein AAB552_02275 [Patescibacteria group bacterium]